jgi:hypothetical protein
MPLLIAELLGAIGFCMASLVGRVLLSLGISFITFVGVTGLISTISSSVMSSMNGLSGDILGLAGYLWIDKGITVVFSAWTAAIALKLAGSDTVTSMISGAKK